MWFNPFMTCILRSPLHGMLDKSTMLITLTGRKSGVQYTTPVNYVRSGEALLTVSFKERTWWRNLRGGAPITIRLAGKNWSGMAEVFEDEAAVMENLKIMVENLPQFARYLAIELDSSGQAQHTSLREAARSRVVVRTRLGIEAGTIRKEQGNGTAA